MFGICLIISAKSLNSFWNTLGNVNLGHLFVTVFQ